MISVFQNSENSGYEYQVAPDMAMTVRMIMIQILAPESVKEQYRQMIAQADEDMQESE